MIIRPKEYNLELPRAMSFHLAPHLPKLVILKILICILILELGIDYQPREQHSMGKKIEERVAYCRQYVYLASWIYGVKVSFE